MDMDYSLLENGLDFILDATQKLLELNDSDLDNRCNQRLIKYALLHLSAGIELVFKYRLFKEHWTYVFADMNKANKKNDSIKSGGKRIQSNIELLFLSFHHLSHFFGHFIGDFINLFLHRANIIFGNGNVLFNHTNFIHIALSNSSEFRLLLFTLQSHLLDHLLTRFFRGSTVERASLFLLGNLNPDSIFVNLRVQI